MDALLKLEGVPVNCESCGRPGAVYVRCTNAACDDTHHWVCPATCGCPLAPYTIPASFLIDETAVWHEAGYADGPPDPDERTPCG